MIDPVDRAVRAVARRNSYALVWAQFGIAHLIMLGGLGLLALYQPMSTQDFLILLVVSQALVAIDNFLSIRLTIRMWRPVRRWEHGARDERSTIAAWTALATLPIDYVRRMRKYPFVFAYLPFIAFATWLLGLPWYSFFILAVVGTVVLTYSLIVRYFTMEVVVRPVLEDVALGLPPDFEIDARSLSLRWRLLAVAPAINVITGVVVAGLSTDGQHTNLEHLGVSWVIAVVVSFTISLELVVLVARSLVSSLGDLQRATERVRSGDYGYRVPVVATDETGRLAQSFNTMVEGLDERDRLRAAFGAYVDPSLAERVVREGADLAGEELEVSIMFLDVRDFSAFAVRDRFGGRIAVGIGVNSGPVVAGTVGGGGRVEFTVIGDAVNTASRVEAATRETGDDVLITDATRELLPGAAFDLRERASVPLKGKQMEVRLWAPKARRQRPSATRDARGRAAAASAAD